MEIKKIDFEKLFYTSTNKQLAKKFCVTERTIINYARRLGLRKSTGGNSRGNKPKIKII